MTRPDLLGRFGALAGDQHHRGRHLPEGVPGVPIEVDRNRHGPGVGGHSWPRGFGGLVDDGRLPAPGVVNVNLGAVLVHVACGHEAARDVRRQGEADRATARARDWGDVRA